MGGKWSKWMAAGTFAGLFFVGGGFTTTLCAQYGQSGQSSQQPAPQLPDKDKAQNNTLTLDNAPPPVNPEEDAAYKGFQDSPAADLQKKIQLGEAFALKYPKSRYLPVIYSALTSAYVQTGQVQKMEEVGDKEIELKPDDVQVLAVLGQTIPRALSSSTANPDQELAKAEKYSKRAIELTPTVPKPPNLTDEAFATAKNQTLAMAHSGLGLVYVRRGKYADAIPELEASVKVDPTPDPVNYYLLGLSNEKTSHFTDAQAAFTKCGELPGSLQATCKKGAEESKKLAETTLSAPK
jgi:tetratricopeptide (TPR) repeat protein